MWDRRERTGRRREEKGKEKKRGKALYLKFLELLY